MTAAPVAFVATTAEGAGAARRARACRRGRDTDGAAAAAPPPPPPLIAMAPAAAAALARSGEKSIHMLYLPPAYAHCWEEFPPAPAPAPGRPPLRVWCDTDQAWEAVRAHRPHAVRHLAGRPTFPAAPLRVDPEAGRFTWHLEHGSSLRNWGPLA